MTDDEDKVVRVDFGGRGAKAAAPDDPAAAQKLEAFSVLIDKGLVLVNLDTRVDGVDVPPSHRGDLQLGLNFSLRFFIDDFQWDEHGVRASLSFGGQPYLCDVPWAAVFLVRSQVSGEAFLFPDSVPTELSHMVDAVRDQIDDGLEEPPSTAPGVAAADAAAPPLGAPAPDEVSPAEVWDEATADEPSSEEGSSEGDAPPDDEPPPDGPPPGGRPRLKLVKS